MSKNKPIPDELDAWIREYIESVRWKFARTYGKTAPHEYTIREWEPERDADFIKAVEIIRTYGYPERYWSSVHWYYQIDEYKYWTMGCPLINDNQIGTILINRADVDTIYGAQYNLEDLDQPRNPPF